MMKLESNPPPAAPFSAPRPNHSGPAAASGSVRIIVADSQAIYRVGMSKIFAAEADLEIAAQVEKLGELHGLGPNFPADVLLLEGGLLAGTTDALPEIVSVMPHIKIIVQTSGVDENLTVELYRRGVRGIIPRSISPELLVRCIRKIAAGETWIDNKSVNWVIEAYRAQATALTSPKNQPRLSVKELAIISHITQGKRNKEIAFQLGTSEQVIKNYLRKIYEKLGVSDRLELALYCLHHQLDKRAKDVLKSPA
ncbi:MAG TPA: response regulator transcription factor [Silvibacterium sp.]|nr:response regulator transcription factor [Silvibacterium sp.]